MKGKKDLSLAPHRLRLDKKKLVDLLDKKNNKTMGKRMKRVIRDQGIRLSENKEREEIKQRLKMMGGVDKKGGRNKIEEVKRNCQGHVRKCRDISPKSRGGTRKRKGKKESIINNKRQEIPTRRRSIATQLKTTKKKPREVETDFEWRQKYRLQRGMKLQMIIRKNWL